MRGVDDLVVVDATPRMLYVESDPESLRRLIDTLPDWIMAPEQTFTVPDPRPKLERPPE